MINDYRTVSSKAQRAFIDICRWRTWDVIWTQPEWLSGGRLNMWVYLFFTCYFLTYNIPQCLRLSGFAAQVLMDAKKIDMDDLDPHRKFTWPVILQLMLKFLSRCDWVRHYETAYRPRHWYRERYFLDSHTLLRWYCTDLLVRAPALIWYQLSWCSYLLVHLLKASLTRQPPYLWVTSNRFPSRSL